MPRTHGSRPPLPAAMLALAMPALGVAILVGAILVTRPAAPARAAGAQPGPDITAEMLRQGGYVIFFRHVLADQGTDAAQVIPEDCNTQRNIADAGLRDARTIGQGFRLLSIPVGQVLSSEFCRALETAHIAFGRSEREMRLNLCCADGRPMTQDDRFAYLAEVLAVQPAEGTNTVIVGHGVGIMSDLGQGEAGIYAPDGVGGFVRVARVLPAEWMSGTYTPARDLRTNVAVTARDNSFEPRMIAIPAGQQVTLTLLNQGEAIHSWRVLGVSDRDGRAITTALLPSGQADTITFTIDQRGEYDFRCDVHPAEQIGKLVVR